jgi:hypothetical protein
MQNNQRKQLRKEPEEEKDQQEKNRRIERRTPKRAHHKVSPERAPLRELEKAVAKPRHLLTALKIRKAVHTNL